MYDVDGAKHFATHSRATSASPSVIRSTRTQSPSGTVIDDPALACTRRRASTSTSRPTPTHPKTSSTISSGRHPSGLGAFGHGSVAPTSAGSGLDDDVDAALALARSFLAKSFLARLARWFSLAMTSFHESLS